MSDSAVPERFGLSTLEDISHLILQSRGLDQTLKNIAKLVSSRMKSEVCSIYLREQDRLTLRATVGLSPSAVGRASLNFDEGLVGYTAKTCSVVNVNEPQQDERYCFIVNSDEEKYHSFLGIPLFDRENLLGVMAIQTVSPRSFSSIEISTLSTIAFQLSTVVANAKLLDQLSASVAIASDSTLPTSPGANQAVSSANAATASIAKSRYGYGSFAIGPALVVGKTDLKLTAADRKASNLSEELERLDAAIAAARIELICLEKRIADRLADGDAAIFHSHLMILQDLTFADKIRVQIRGGLSAIGGVKRVVAQYADIFRQLDDPYLRSRGTDVEDVGRRVISQLRGETGQQTPSISRPSIVVAEELLPSEIAVMDLQQVLGLVVGRGDSNSHAVIIAKSLGIPTLIGLGNELAGIEEATPLVIDAATKTLHIWPSEAITEEYQRLTEDEKQQSAALQKFVDQPGKTRDGHEVTFRANIGLRSDVEVARRCGARGVGLYRTELPYMARASFPDRQTQYEIYRYVVENFRGEPVTIRTLDIGGDKPLSYFDSPAEENPFLGWRSVRVSLECRAEFQTQLEAILMAATHGHVRLMFPMITTIDEIIECKSMVDAAKLRLQDEGWTIPAFEIGMMIETPASVTMADRFSKHVDFFSLGTNDLVQYLLATDRGNPKVSSLYDALHPAVLRAIKRIVEIGQRENLSVSICGEMASDPVALLLLVGLGVTDFSLSAPSISGLKQTLSRYTRAQLDQWTNEILELDRGTEIRQAMEAKIASI